MVELGAGTGPVTLAIRQRLAGRGRHLAVEVNPRLARLLAERWPDVEVIEGDAARLPEILADRGLERADVIVSGLPWTVFPAARAARTLAAVASVMAPHAAFTTFGYLHALWTPPAQRLRENLARTFEEVVAGRTVWANLPPALVYHARRPLPLDRSEVVVHQTQAVR